MTFNLRGSFIDDGENRWSNRAALCVRTIRGEDPDLIGFQEVQQGNLDAFASGLPGYERWIGPQYNNREPFAYPSIFWKPDKLQKLDSGEFWLSRTPERFSGDWDTACIRSAGWIRFRDRQTRQEFVHLNTHLDHISAEARLEGSRVILCELGARFADGTATVVTGDFNCLPDSDPYNLFVGHGFQDVHRLARQPDGDEVFTFHAFTGRRQPEQERIDWILLRDPGRRLRAGRCGIVTAADPPLFPSDHYPVVADFATTPASPS